MEVRASVGAWWDRVEVARELVEAGGGCGRGVAQSRDATWRTKFAVLMARERGRIGSDAALGDMPKRLQAHSYDEMNEGPAR